MTSKTPGYWFSVGHHSIFKWFYNIPSPPAEARAVGSRSCKVPWHHAILPNSWCRGELCDKHRMVIGIHRLKWNTLTTWTCPMVFVWNSKDSPTFQYTYSISKVETHQAPSTHSLISGQNGWLNTNTMNRIGPLVIHRQLPMACKLNLCMCRSNGATSVLLKARWNFWKLWQVSFEKWSYLLIFGNLSELILKFQLY